MIDVSAKIQQARQFFEAGKGEQARALLARALQQTPGHPDLSNAMSLVLCGLGQFELAAYHAERATLGRPQEAGYFTNLGNALTQAAKPAPAVAAYEKSIALNPRDAGARLGISHVLRLTHRFSEAAEHLKAGLQIEPGDPQLTSNLAFLLLKLARVEEAVEAAESGLAAHPDNFPCSTALAHSLNYMPGASGKRVLEAHARYGRLLCLLNPARWMEFPNRADPERRLKVGLLSSDFYRHPIAFFIESLLEHHDRGAFELVCYFTGAREDDTSRRLKAMADGWKHLKAPHAKVAEEVHRDGVDILIELAGMAANHNLPVMAMRPAPVQANYLGYPSTTGVPTIDYRIVDGITDPPAHDAYASEKLVRIDPSFLCYRGAPDAPAPRAVGGAVGGSGVVFGSFNSAPKINRDVVRMWSRLLKETPGSKLLLKALEFDDPGLATDIVSRFEAHGVERHRVEIVKILPGYTDHLSLYSRIDVALDPFPYNGTTTTFEALFMGVPVVTLTGDRHVSRVSTQILQNLGMPELIGSDEDAYIRIAKGLAADGARRALLRDTLRPRLLQSPLCDGKAFAGRMQDALRGMWRAWCAGRGR